MANDEGPTGNSQIDQLNHARTLALTDPTMYLKLLPAILPILNSVNNPSPELRAWGADFLAEAFSSPTFPSEGKQEMAVRALPVVKDLLNLPSVSLDQIAMVKSAIQAASSIYPLIFRFIIRNPQDTETWQTMSSIKSNILRRMDTELPGIRILCLRFVERIVQTQTPGVIADPRRPDSNETSLALVPADHTILKPQNLEAEALGLLDRALGVLQENHSDPLLVTATLNGLGGLMRTRATIANRILNAVLNYNPFRLANSPMTPAAKLIMRSMEKTVVIFLTHILKRAPQHPMAARIEQHILRLQQMRKDVVEGAGLKRPAEEPAETISTPKKQRLATSIPIPAAAPPLPPGPVSLAQLFTLTTDPSTINMNVKAIPPDMAAPVLVNLLRLVGKDQMEHAMNTVRSRFQEVTARAQPPIQTTTPLDDEDDYEPDYFPAEDETQLKNRLEVDEPGDARLKPVSESVAVYRLPKPPPMPPAQLDAIAYASADRMFDNLSRLMAMQETSESKRGFSDPVLRGAMNAHSYFRTIVRTAIRPFASPEVDTTQTPYADYIRQRLLQFILSEWQRRIGFAITWFTEEFISESLIYKQPAQTNGHAAAKSPATGHYKRWILRFLSDLSAYLGGGKQDMKVLVRFVGEIPLLDEDILNKVAAFADDPERVSTVSAAVRYLIVYRPSVKEAALDALQLVWQYEGRVKDGPNAKLLMKMRPGFVEQALEA